MLVRWIWLETCVFCSALEYELMYFSRFLKGDLELLSCLILIWQRPQSLVWCRSLLLFIRQLRYCRFQNISLMASASKQRQLWQGTLMALTLWQRRCLWEARWAYNLCVWYGCRVLHRMPSHLLTTAMQEINAIHFKRHCDDTVYST